MAFSCIFSYGDCIDFHQWLVECSIFSKTLRVLSPVHDSAHVLMNSVLSQVLYSLSLLIQFSFLYLLAVCSQEERISFVDGRPYAMRLISPPDQSPDSPRANKVAMSVTAAFVAGARRLSGLLFAPLHGLVQPAIGTSTFPVSTTVLSSHVY